MSTLLFAVVALGLLGTLQVWLDRRARRAPKLDRFHLHWHTTPNGPVVCDEDGRRLDGIRLMQYRARYGEADVIVLEVLAHDGNSFFVLGRPVGGKSPNTKRGQARATPRVSADPLQVSPERT